VSASDGGSLLSLDRDQLVPGVAVSGTVALAPDPIPLDGETVTANLTAKAPGLASATLTASWTTTGADAQAQLVGTIGKASVSGSMPAP
jgi:hypothetical protein